MKKTTRTSSQQNFGLGLGAEGAVHAFYMSNSNSHPFPEKYECSHLYLVRRLNRSTNFETSVASKKSRKMTLIYSVF